MAMVPDLAMNENIDLMAAGSPYVALKAEMAKVVPDETKVATLAAATIQLLDKVIVALESGKLDATRLAPLIKQLAARKPDPQVSWDVATQSYLARSALIRAGLVSPTGKEHEAVFKALEFPNTPRYDSPHYSPSGTTTK